MIDDSERGEFYNRVRSLLHRALPHPWHDLLSLRGMPRSKAVEEATLELAHLAPELAKALVDGAAADRVAQLEGQINDLEERVAELEAELEDVSSDTAANEECTRLTAENDRLRAEMARLTAALNGTLVDGEPR